MPHKIHYKFRGRLLCGLRAAGRRRSVHLTSTDRVGHTTCLVCLKAIRASFFYEGFALFDEHNSIIFPSTAGTRDGVEGYAERHYGARWAARGYRVEPVRVVMR